MFTCVKEDGAPCRYYPDLSSLEERCIIFVLMARLQGRRLNPLLRVMSPVSYPYSTLRKLSDAARTSTAPQGRSTLPTTSTIQPTSVAGNGASGRYCPVVSCLPSTRTSFILQRRNGGQSRCFPERLRGCSSPGSMAPSLTVKMAVRTGFAPVTYRLTTECSTGLS